MDASLLANLVAYSAQIACVAVVGSLLPALLRVNAAGVRYIYWRALLALCLLLPWIQGRQAPLGADTATASAGVVATSSFSVTPSVAVFGTGFPWQSTLAAILVGGMVLRLIWMAVSLLRLRRLRTAGRAEPLREEHEELQRIIGARAEIRYVAGLGQPVTFGAWRPIILLPDALRTHPPSIERAVLCHELLHVQRRDWMWMLGEEAVRAALWFHPAVWWLISRIQLTREEVVDELAVLATGHRRTYMEALMTFADDTPLAPATAFARRRHLFRRIVLISKEAVMSSRRVVLSCAVMVAIVAAGSWFALRAFPLMASAAQGLQTEPGPLEKRAKPITPENPVPRRVHAVTPQYPTDAMPVGVSATVTLQLTLDEFGRVAEVRRTGVGIVPIGASASATAQTDPQAMLAALDALVRSAAAAVRQWQYDPPADGPISISVTFSFHPDSEPRLVSHQGAFGSITVPPPPPPPPPAPTAPAWVEGALRVGGNVKAPTKVKHVMPEYPALAKAARVQGTVIIEARVEPDGRVGQARVLHSIPLLDQAALDAVRQWEFMPTLMNGQPVPVIMTTTVQFMVQ